LKRRRQVWRLKFLSLYTPPYKVHSPSHNFLYTLKIL
jgi:hypothetical protein